MCTYQVLQSKKGQYLKYKINNLAGIDGLNPAGNQTCLGALYVVCDGPIPCPDESFCLRCLILCDLETARRRCYWLALCSCAKGKINNLEPVSNEKSIKYLRAVLREMKQDTSLEVTG
jgi:hypothetical protein